MFVHTVIMVIEPHMKQGRQHKLISTIFLATSVTKKLDHNKPIPIIRNPVIMNKIPITIAAISQYTIPETILFEIPLLNCPKESAPVTNSRNRFMIPLPIVPKKVIQSLRKTGERIAVNSVVAMLYHANRNIRLS